jgi:polyphosphate kinase 2 (PPK2 family)
MDLESVTRWEDYSRAKDEMFVHTDIPEAPGMWWKATTSGGPGST